MNSSTLTVPARFVRTEDPHGLGTSLHRGPVSGAVTTSWMPEEGVRVYAGDNDNEGMTVRQAQQLAAELIDVLSQLQPEPRANNVRG